MILQNNKHGESRINMIPSLKMSKDQEVRMKEMLTSMEIIIRKIEDAVVVTFL